MTKSHLRVRLCQAILGGLHSHSHTDGNRPNGDVLPTVDLVTCVPHCFDSKVETKDKDQRSDDHDRCGSATLTGDVVKAHGGS